MSDSAARWPISVELPIQWGEMDAFAHVNNVTYLRWFETARIAYFEAAGLLARMASERVGPILARQIIDYRIPLTWPDRVLAQASVTRLGKSSFTMALRVTSVSRGGAVAAEGDNIIVLLDYNKQQSVPIWEELRARITAIEGGAQL